MTLPATRSLRNTIALLVVILALSACGGGDDPQPCTTCPPPDLIAQANAALEDELFKHLNANAPDDEPDHPDDVDFTAANELFRDAFEANPESLSARFGVAMTDLLVLSVDTEVNAAFDEWDQYLEDRVPFEVEGSVRRPLGIPLTPARGVAALALPFDVIPMSIVARTRPGLFAIDPQIDRVLQILEQRVLPRLNSAADHLDIVGASSSFKYIVTGRMQGDDEEESVEIDQTDIVALRAATHLLIAAVNVALAYEVNIATYDSVGMFTALSPGSSFGTLKSTGVTRLQTAHAEITLAIDDIEMATDLLLAESDSQADDVIKIGPKDVAQADFDSIRANIANARLLMSTGYTRVDNWDGDRDTPEVALTVNAGAFFTAPIQDLKALSPAYSVRVELRALNTESDFTSGQVEIQLTVASSRNYFASASLYTDDGEEGEYYGGDPELRDPVFDFLRARLESARSSPNFVDYSGSVYFSGSLNAGENTAVVSYSRTIDLALSYIYVPVIVWEATSFESWTWPDPTFGGVLPDMQSSAQFLSTFGIDDDDWDPELVVDLSDLGKTVPAGTRAATFVQARRR